MAKIIHSMIRVLDVERSKEFYQQAFGLVQKRYMDFEDFALVYLGNDESEFELELTVNKGREEPYTHGSGYGHIAVCVNDLKSEHARVEALGLEPQNIVEFSDNNVVRAKFFFMEDPDGYEIEVLQRMGDYT